MTFEGIILSIIGFICTAAMMANAYFLKGLLEELSSFKLGLAVFGTKFGHYESRTDNLEVRMNNKDKFDNDTRESLHDVRNTLGNRILVIEMDIKALKGQ